MRGVKGLRVTGDPLTCLVVSSGSLHLLELERLAGHRGPSPLLIGSQDGKHLGLGCLSVLIHLLRVALGRSALATRSTGLSAAKTAALAPAATLATTKASSLTALAAATTLAAAKASALATITALAPAKAAALAAAATLPAAKAAALAAATGTAGSTGAVRSSARRSHLSAKVLEDILDLVALILGQTEFLGDFRSKERHRALLLQNEFAVSLELRLRQDFFDLLLKLRNPLIRSLRSSLRSAAKAAARRSALPLVGRRPTLVVHLVGRRPTLTAAKASAIAALPAAKASALATLTAAAALTAWTTASATATLSATKDLLDLLNLVVGELKLLLNVRPHEQHRSALHHSAAHRLSRSAGSARTTLSSAALLSARRALRWLLSNRETYYCRQCQRAEKRFHYSSLHAFSPASR